MEFWDKTHIIIKWQVRWARRMRNKYSKLSFNVYFYKMDSIIRAKMNSNNYVSNEGVRLYGLQNMLQ
jgi:hypothetical protein